MTMMTILAWVIIVFDVFAILVTAKYLKGFPEVISSLFCFGLPIIQSIFILLGR